jgi:hypothetical protein
MQVPGSAKAPAFVAVKASVHACKSEIRFARVAKYITAPDIRLIKCKDNGRLCKKALLD